MTSSELRRTTRDGREILVESRLRLVEGVGRRRLVLETGRESTAHRRAKEAELQRRERAYRDGRRFPSLRDRTLILIDDGLATGSTMRAAVEAVRSQGPRRVVVAVPTAAPATCEEFRRIADDCVCVITPEPFYAVGLWYEDFSQTTDEEVRELLAKAG